ncbi:MAG: hypothetical protein U0263_41005 [Polyangiaceae bacterium]
MQEPTLALLSAVFLASAWGCAASDAGSLGPTGGAAGFGSDDSGGAGSSGTGAEAGWDGAVSTGGGGMAGTPSGGANASGGQGGSGGAGGGDGGVAGQSGDGGGGGQAAPQSNGPVTTCSITPYPVPSTAASPVTAAAILPSFQCLPSGISCGLFALERECDAAEDCARQRALLRQHVAVSTPSACQASVSRVSSPRAGPAPSAARWDPIAASFPGARRGFLQDQRAPGRDPVREVIASLGPLIGSVPQA